ncbi:cis-3-hydroxy-L-proline dehydratase [Paracoccus benzoatiresistens]|uniref:Aconitase family protein n=1 Tax=Paracoccus benzoatiresistens TaxID=2997341 RepID=A0ABT4JAH5_9RHOB|nr:aconitase family protein [Paracoccus sp. EF6]MCZ0963710.1 aconitase family protein [Paracoccus sp. EF6]
MSGVSILSGTAQGPVIATTEPLSFWGGIDPATATVIDVHHPLHGRCLSGAIVLMPGTRGSCTGSGVLLDMVLQGRAPAALVFSEPEDVVTLGALIASRMFDRPLPVLRLTPQDFAALARQPEARITRDAIFAGELRVPLAPLPEGALTLTDADRAMLAGAEGPAVQQAMQILTRMAAAQGAAGLLDVTQGHIDGCIYASPANLTFAEAMVSLGARVRIPTTMNAISVDRENWRTQGVPALFGGPAQRLADAYVRMGCQPSFTCAPYLLDNAPAQDDQIAWSESNAVIYANSVLGARTGKHPDFLDLCIALTGRAPLTGVYLDEHRAAMRVLDFDVPAGADDALWPLIGWLAGGLSPDRIPLLRGLAKAAPAPDDLKALCAAFGTTSAAPMLHVEGVTPEAHRLSPDADHRAVTRTELAEAWRALNAGPDAVDLVAIGSPHASLAECRALAEALAGQRPVIPVIVTAGRNVIEKAQADGTLDQLTAAGAQVIPDLCWCSISEPVFPPATRAVMTNSGKYAHYGPGLSGRPLRFGSMADCAAAALTGRAPSLPRWLEA